MSPLLTRDGKTMFVLNSGRGGGPQSVSVIETASLRELSRTPVEGAWLGLALTSDEKRLYVSGGSKPGVHEFAVGADGKLSLLRTFAVEPVTFVGDVQLSPDGRLLYAAAPLDNGVVVINPQSGRVVERWKTGRRPYRIAFHPDGKSFFVSSWADGSVYQYRTTDGEQLGLARLAQQPMDMVLSSKPVEVDEEGESKPFWKHRLFVTAANSNAVYVLGISEIGEIRLADTINIALSPRHPLGMTPLALSLSADEKTLYVACADADAIAVVSIAGAKGVLKGHLPAKYPTGAKELGSDRLAILNDGSVAVAKALHELPAYTKQVRAATAYSDATLDVAVNPGAIRNVVYIVCEGPLEGANAAKLGAEFAALDRVAKMPASSTVESMYWASAAIVPPFVRLLNPGSVGDPAGLPAAGYLWSNASSAGLSVKNYGFLVSNGKVLDPGLARYTNLKFSGTDAAPLLEDWTAAASQGAPARLTVVRLAAGRDADAVLGKIVAGISKTPAWANTAIFVSSVASTRGLVVSPYTRLGGRTDTTQYTQTSFLRTVELLLGLRPMTQFDAAAVPISGVFQAEGNAAAYEPPAVP
jgi:DNA-binding beta-propeller fold protein YncE